MLSKLFDDLCGAAIVLNLDFLNLISTVFADKAVRFHGFFFFRILVDSDSWTVLLA